MNAPLGVWSIIVEFTLPVTEDDIAILHDGDAECDFANRAIDRLRPKLNEITDGGNAMGWMVLRQVGNNQAPTSEELRQQKVWARRCSA